MSRGRFVRVSGNGDVVVSHNLCYGFPVTSLDTVRELLRDRSSRIALVGASNASHKYGNIILRDLGARGYTVIPVNRHESEVAGIPALSSVSELTPPVAIINVVVPPENALEVVRNANPDVCPVIWFQPGAFDAQVIESARTRFPTVIVGDCIMVVARQV